MARPCECDGDGDQRGERRQVRVHHRRARQLLVRRTARGEIRPHDLLVGGHDGVQAHRRRHRDGSQRDARHHDERRECRRGRRVRAAATAAAHRDARAAHQRSGVDHGAVGTGDACASRRSLRRRERQRDGRACARRHASGDLPARARLPPADDQREDRRSPRRSRGAQRLCWRRCGDGHAVRPPHSRGSRREQECVRAGVGGPLLHRRPRAVHDLLCRYRRLERVAARHRDPVARPS